MQPKESKIAHSPPPRAPHRPRSLINAPTPTPPSCERLKSHQISRDPLSSQIDFSSNEVQNQARYTPVGRQETLNTLPRPLLPAEHKHIIIHPSLRFLIKKRPVRPHGGHLVTSPSYLTLFKTPYLEFEGTCPSKLTRTRFQQPLRKPPSTWATHGQYPLWLGVGPLMLFYRHVPYLSPMGLRFGTLINLNFLT